MLRVLDDKMRPEPMVNYDVHSGSSNMVVTVCLLDGAHISVNGVVRLQAAKALHAWLGQFIDWREGKKARDGGKGGR